MEILLFVSTCSGAMCRHMQVPSLDKCQKNPKHYIFDHFCMFLQLPTSATAPCKLFSEDRADSTRFRSSLILSWKRFSYLQAEWLWIAAFRSCNLTVGAIAMVMLQHQGGQKPTRFTNRIQQRQLIIVPTRCSTRPRMPVRLFTLVRRTWSDSRGRTPPL